MTASRGALKIINAADIVARDIEWLWFGRVAKRFLSVVTGDPEAGKTYVDAYIASVTSRGYQFFGDNRQRQPGNVLWFESGENPLSEVMVPRLEQLGADGKRINFVTGTTTEDGWFSLDTDREMLKAELGSTPYELVIFDALLAHIGNTDDMRDSKLRKVLNPLTQIADEYNVAILYIIHCNKNESQKDDLPDSEFNS